MEEIMRVDTEQNEVVFLYESKVMAHFGVFGLS